MYDYFERGVCQRSVFLQFSVIASTGTTTKVLFYMQMMLCHTHRDNTLEHAHGDRLGPSGLIQPPFYHADRCSLSLEVQFLLGTNVVLHLRFFI